MIESSNKYSNEVQEDEIDLKELFIIIWKKKYFVAIFTFTITIMTVIYVNIKTPIYEVKSNIQLGFIGENLLNEPESLNQELNIVFNVGEPSLNNTPQNAWVTDVSVNKKVNNFIEIKTSGFTNEFALAKNKEIIQYIQKQNQVKIDNFVRNIKQSIIETKKDLVYIDEIEIKDIKREIEKLKKQKLVMLTEKIAILKNQDIKSLRNEVEIIKSQKIPSINDKIRILNDKLKMIQNKITFNKNKLVEYNKAISELYKNNQNSASTEKMISSIQMVNYQNLILNLQNKIEDLILEQKIITTETIPSLENEKYNLETVTIKNILNKIENIYKIDIFNLEHEKENITNDSIKKLEEKINITLKDKKLALENKIKNLEYQISNVNYSNSKIIGDYILYENPISPKKALTISVALVTGFIVSIFLVFLINFIQKIKEN